MPSKKKRYLRRFREFTMNGMDCHRQEWTDGYRLWTEWWIRENSADEYRKCSRSESKALEKEYGKSAASRDGANTYPPDRR